MNLECCTTDKKEDPAPAQSASGITYEYNTAILFRVPASVALSTYATTASPPSRACRCSIEDNIAYSTASVPLANPPHTDRQRAGREGSGDLGSNGAAAGNPRPHPETDPRVVAAARVANAHDFVSALPEQYRTQVRETPCTALCFLLCVFLCSEKRCSKHAGELYCALLIEGLPREGTPVPI